MFGRVAYLACVIGTAAAGAAQAQDLCWQPHEVAAARVRDLQTMLMVGTLQCNAVDPIIVANYNRFVANNRQMLVGENNVLKAHFMRARGILAGARAYDSFTTLLANRHSASGKGSDASFCQTVGSLAELAGVSTPAEVRSMAETYTMQPAGVDDICVAASPTTIAAISPPAAVPVAVSSGVQPGIAAVPTAAAPPAASDDQLRAATAALQAAVTALQAAVAARAQATAQPAPVAVVESSPDEVFVIPE